MGEYARDSAWTLLRDRQPHGLEEIRALHPRWRTGLRQLVAWGYSFERNGNELRLLPKAASKTPLPESAQIVEELIAFDPDPDPDAPVKVVEARPAERVDKGKRPKRKKGVEFLQRKARERSDSPAHQGDGDPGVSDQEAPAEAQANEERAEQAAPAVEEIGQGREARLDVATGLELGASFVTETVAIIAKKGSGKSYTAMVFGEELCRANLPFAVLDPTGAWWGLGWGRDGDPSKGMNVPIVGGEHGDFQVRPRHGSAVALWCVERYPQRIIVDLSLLTPEEQHIFAYYFFATLFMKNRRAMHVFVDEADEFAAQTPKSPMEQKVLGQVDRVVRRGRIRGIGITLITQRSAVLNKNVLTQVGMLLTLKTAGPQDLKAIEGWIARHLEGEETAKIMRALPGLPRGVLFRISSDGRKPTRHEVRRKLTFDSSRTPEVGEEVPEVAPRAFDVGELAAFIEEHAIGSDQGPDQEGDAGDKLH